jgi:hypothetical protein
MTNQFFYTRKEGDKEFTDSFNVGKVIRSIQVDEDELVVLLDDIHERVEEKPTVNPRNNKIVGVQRKRDIFQSDIHLHGEDIKRFKKLTNIEF